MRWSVPYILLPASVLLIGLRKCMPREISESLALGAFAGLVGTLFYDLFRWPFVEFAGYRLFATINGFGMFITDAPYSTAWTEAVGWTYHFVNGVCFGIMYALLARKRHWAWGVCWGILIEALAVLSPFGQAFALTSNSVALTLAFLGHIAYGLPLGFLVQKSDETLTWLRKLHPGLSGFSTLCFLLWMLSPVFDSDRHRLEQNLKRGELLRVGGQTFPDWIQLEQRTLTVSNRGQQAGRYVVPKKALSLELEAGESGEIEFSAAGIYQIYLSTSERSHSSFIWVSSKRVFNN